MLQLPLDSLVHQYMRFVRRQQQGLEADLAADDSALDDSWDIWGSECSGALLILALHALLCFC